MKKQKKEPRKKQPPFQFEIADGGEMSEEDAEQIAAMVAQWIHEQNEESKQPKKPPSSNPA